MGHPKPLRPLFFTEMWERFSYYSIRPLLVLFMVATVGSGGFGFDEVTASAIYGIFAGSLYLAAVPGVGSLITGLVKSVPYGGAA